MQLALARDQRRTRAYEIAVAEFVPERRKRQRRGPHWSMLKPLVRYLQCGESGGASTLSHVAASACLVPFLMSCGVAEPGEDVGQGLVM